MKKVLLMMLLGVGSITVWGQASHTTYKFNGTSDGILFTDALGTIDADDENGKVCNQTYYLKVGYQHTTAPATTDGPKTFYVKDYYVDGVCTYGQTYDAGKEYSIVSSHLGIDEGNINTYTKDSYVFTSNSCWGVTWCKWDGVGDFNSNKVIVQAGEALDLDATYYASDNQYNTQTGNSLSSAIGKQSKLFINTDKIYILSGEIYTQIPSEIYDPAQTYYVVTFTLAEPSAVIADANFKTSKLVDLNADTRTLYHKNGTSYNAVSNGDQFFDDDEYYIAGISYQPCTPEQLASLGYANATTSRYNCDVTVSADNQTLTITYKNYDNSYKSMADYVKDCTSEIDKYPTIAFVSNVANSDVWVINNLYSGIIDGLSKYENVKNAVFENFQGYNADWSKLNNVIRVILPNDFGLETNTSFKRATENTPIYQVYNSTTKKETIDITSAGNLGIIKDFHYYSDNIDNAYWIEIKGNINASDIEFINGIHNDRLNLSRAKNAVGGEEDLRTAMHSFTNDYVKYLAWPVFATEPSDPLYKDLYTQCDKLIAVGQFVADEIPGYGKLVANTKEEGGIRYITEMLGEVTKAPASTTSNSGIRHAKISGNLKAEDLFHETTSSARGLAADGHLYLYPAADEYAGTQSRISVESLDGITDFADADNNHKPTVHTGALSGLYNIISLDLSDAVFSRYEDMTLSKLGIVGAATKTILLPTSSSVKDIPADFMNVSCVLNEIMIPSNIENIHARAFAGSDIMHVWTNNTSAGVACDNGATYEIDADKNLGSYTDIEEKPEGAKMVYGTYTLSPNLKFIGTNVFGSSTHIHDVYMLGRTAPVCNVNAFSTVSYVANNSYQADAVPEKIDRDAYANTTYAWMTMLHFPAECTDDEASLYTDITRRYSIASDKRDGNGNIVYYPTQCEWNRSFVQGTTGYLWNAFCNKRNPYSGTAMAFYITNAWHQQALADGTPNNNTQNTILYGTGTSQATYQATANGMYNTNDEEESVKSKEVFYDTSSDGSTALAYNTSLYNADYRGWHQFVLAEYGYSDEIVINFEDFYDSNWWTICEPFPLTSAELKKAFGDKVKLCKLVSVTRNVENGGIRLNFGPNLVGTDQANGYTLQAGVPYMIKPALPTDGTTLDQKLSYEVNNTTDNIERFAEKTADELETLLTEGMYTVDAILVNNTGDCKEPEVDGPNGTKIHENLKYTMMGTFFKYYLPQYCYFLGWDNEYNGPAFFWHDEVADKGDRNWNPYTAVIVPNWIGVSNPFEHPAAGEFDTIHYRYSSTGAIGENDDFVVTSSTKRMTLNFAADDDDETTEIQTIHIGNTTYYDGNVYNMNGQLISNDGNLNTLPKGIYIVNGKKYISK